MRYRVLLPICNAVACGLFVLLRAPLAPGYLAEVDAAWRNGAMHFDSGSGGVLACRSLNSWSSFHGGEHIGVKALEAVNVAPLVATGLVHVVAWVASASASDAPLASACTWSWGLAAVFILLATAQWLALGAVLDRVAPRFQRRAA